MENPGEVGRKDPRQPAIYFIAVVWVLIPVLFIAAIVRDFRSLLEPNTILRIAVALLFALGWEIGGVGLAMKRRWAWGLLMFLFAFPLVAYLVGLVVTISTLGIGASGLMLDICMTLALIGIVVLLVWVRNAVSGGFQQGTRD